MYSIVLLSSSTINLQGGNPPVNITGNKVHGAGYTNTIGNNHTISVNINNFVGRIYIEGSLATDPQDYDWFAIPLTSNGDPYQQFPLDPANPTGGQQGDTGVSFYSFAGNFKH